MTRLGRGRVARWAAIAAVTCVGGLIGAPSAGANHVRPRYYTLQIPARDDAPQNVRLYATLGGVGNGNRIGDPVLLATRAGLNPKQEWLLVDHRYPNLPEEVVTNGTGWDCWIPICGPQFQGRSNVSGGRSKLVSRYSGKCLSISGTVAHGADIVQRTYRETDSKQVWWILVDVRRNLSLVTPVHWYRSGELRCLGQGPGRAGRQLTVYRRQRSSEPCPHWVVGHAVTGFWRRPFTNPF